MSEPDFSKMTTREILDWKYRRYEYEYDNMIPTPPGVEMELVGISKHELARLRELEAQVLSEARTCRRNPVLDCRTLAKKLLQVKPELREWLEVNFKEYL